MAMTAFGTPARADDGPVSSERAATMPCADLLFVGARESGGALPYGAVVGPIRDAVRAGWHGTMREVYLDYPAADPHDLTRADIEAMIFDVEPPTTRYRQSVVDGVERLRTVLADSTTRCPSEQIVLVGLSQGAQVITEALSRGPTVPRLRGALLLGNPLHHPGQNVRELDGQVDTPAIGLDALLTYLRSVAAPGPNRNRTDSVHDVIAAVLKTYEGKVSNQEIATALHDSPATLPAALYPRVFSACLSGDMVCDSAGPLSRVLSQQSTLDQEYALARPFHLGYTSDVVRRSLAAILAADLPGSPIPHTATPPSGPPAEPAGLGPGAVLAAALGLLALVGLVVLAYGAGRRSGRSGH